MLSEDSFLFWKYADKYGVRRNEGDIDDGELIGFRDDAPEEVKKSWEEYQKLEEKWRAEGIK